MTVTKLLPEGPVFFDQVREGVPLPTAQPASQRTQHHLQRREVDYEPELTSRLRIMSAGMWNTTGSAL